MLDFRFFYKFLSDVTLRDKTNFILIDTQTLNVYIFTYRVFECIPITKLI